jgi:hypothetical protein
VEALKDLPDVQQGQDEFRWGKIQRVTGKSVDELKGIAGVQ